MGFGVSKMADGGDEPTSFFGKLLFPLKRKLSALIGIGSKRPRVEEKPRAGGPRSVGNGPDLRNVAPRTPPWVNPASRHRLTRRRRRVTGRAWTQSSPMLSGMSRFRISISMNSRSHIRERQMNQAVVAAADQSGNVASTTPAPPPPEPSGVETRRQFRTRMQAARPDTTQPGGDPMNNESSDEDGVAEKRMRLDSTQTNEENQASSSQQWDMETASTSTNGITSTLEDNNGSGAHTRDEDDDDSDSESWSSSEGGSWHPCTDSENELDEETGREIFGWIGVSDGESYSSSVSTTSITHEE